MRVYGVDFTSSPSRRKPIVVAEAALAQRRLRLTRLLALQEWGAFESFLAQPGPWVAGFDFPFGQPRALVEALGWPTEWVSLARLAGRLTVEELAEQFEGFRSERPPGARHCFRRTDRVAGACSPMMLVRVPVARMWLTGAPRLEAAGLSILPCRPRPEQRVAMEVYPALQARVFIGRVSYKREGRDRDARRLAARRALLSSLVSTAATRRYGFAVHVPGPFAASLAEDGSGDRLDAVLCAISAAWAWSQRRRGWGIPRDADPLEGWIVDPTLTAAGTHGPSKAGLTESDLGLPSD